MSKIILGIHIIGGAGNTTNIKMLYNKLVEEGKKVSIINADSYQSVYEAKYKVFNANTNSEVKKQILELKKDYEYIIIDTKPMRDDDFNKMINELNELVTFTIFSNRYMSHYKKDSIEESEDVLGIKRLLNSLKDKNIAYFEFDKNKEKIIDKAIKTLIKI